MRKLYTAGTVSPIDTSSGVDIVEQILDILHGIQSDVSQITSEYNAEVYKVLDSLPKGKTDTRWTGLTNNINAKLNGLDGDNVFVDNDATSTTDGGRFWSNNRPKTIREALLSLHTEIANSIDRVRIETNTGTTSLLTVYNSSPIISNIVDDAARYLVLDGITLTATSIGSGAVKISSALTTPSTAKIVVGNSGAEDTSATCDYIDAGDGVQLAAAIAAADSDNDVYIKPGIYDFSLGSITDPITIPTGVSVKGAGINNTIIRTNTSGDQGAFILGIDSNLSDLSIQVKEPTVPGTTSTGVVSFQGRRGKCWRTRVSFLSSASWTNLANLYLTSCFEFKTSTAFYDSFLVDCECGYSGETIPSLITSIGASVANGFSGVKIELPSGSQVDPGVTIRNLHVYGADFGVSTKYRCILSDSSIVDTDYYGILLDSGSSKSVISGNEIYMTISSARAGIFISGSESNSVLSNLIENKYSVGYASQAIYLSNGDKNNITGNIATGKWTYGAVLNASSTGNIVVANNFTETSSGVNNSGLLNTVDHNIA